METKDGFLVINKDQGCTSHDCVKQIRKLLNTKKVGHTGTLDPEVMGTLPIAIGSATRFIQYLPQGKTYIGQVKLGIRTNTDDIHGEIINQKSWPKISLIIDKIVIIENAKSIDDIDLYNSSTRSII